MSTKLLQLNGITNLPYIKYVAAIYHGIIECAECNLGSYLTILWSNWNP
jgi:hypothetical protein